LPAAVEFFFDNLHAYGVYEIEVVLGMGLRSLLLLFEELLHMVEDELPEPHFLFIIQDVPFLLYSIKNCG
jgi:hypothetical protein